MNCQQINEIIYDYCDGNVTPEIAEAVEKHLQECPFCRNNEKLTRMENKTLHEYENSQTLQLGFTEKIMGSIKTGYYTNNKGLINKWIEYNQQHKYIPSVGIIAVILIIITAGSMFHNIAITGRIADNGQTINSINKQTAKQKLTVDTVPDTNQTTGKAANLINPSKSNKTDSQSDADVKSTQTPVEIYSDSEKTAVSDQEVLNSASGQSAAISSAEKRLEPVDIPAKYKLNEITSNAQNTTFSYSTSDQSGRFGITISPESNQTTFKAKSVITDSCQFSLRDSFPPISWKINQNGRTYTIELTGNLPSEELQSLADSIKFEEKPYNN